MNSQQFLKQFKQTQVSLHSKLGRYGMFVYMLPNGTSTLFRLLALKYSMTVTNHTDNLTVMADR